MVTSTWSMIHQLKFWNPDRLIVTIKSVKNLKVKPMQYLMDKKSSHSDLWRLWAFWFSNYLTMSSSVSFFLSGCQKCGLSQGNHFNWYPVTLICDLCWRLHLDTLYASGLSILSSLPIHPDHAYIILKEFKIHELNRNCLTNNPLRSKEI